MGKRDNDAGRELTVGDVLDRHTSSESQEIPMLEKGAERTTPYLTEMIERAQQSGRPLEDILAEDLDSPAAITARTPECLHPSEVRRAVDRTLEPQRERHLLECHSCRVLVQIALPKPEEFSRLLFRIQQNQSAEVAASDAMAGGIPRATFPQRVHSLDVKNKDANFVAPTQDVEKAQAKKAIPDGYHTVTVQLTLDNAARAIDWYKKALGAEEVARAVGPDGKIMHAELRIGDSRIMMNDAILGGKGPKANGGSPAALWIYLGDCDALFNRAIGAGAQVKMPMADQFWGDRCGTFTDPHGYSWTIATRKEDLTHEEMLQRQEVFMKQFARPPAHA